MENNVGAVILTPSKSKIKSKQPENVNPNVTSPNLKSPALKSAKKSDSKKPHQISWASPKNKIRERKFIVAKKNKAKAEKDETLISVDCKCKAGGNTGRCLCVAYETLRASQEDFFKNQTEGLVEGKSQVGEVSGDKRRRDDKLVDVVRESIPGSGSGKVMNLVKAFENILTLPKSDDDDVEKDQQEDEDGKKWEFSSSLYCTPDLLLTAENLGLCSCASLDSNHGRSSSGGRQGRRNSSESSSNFGGGRWKRTARATSQQPFKLRTEQRGKLKQEEFMKKVQEMMVEQEKQRIPIAQGLPWTTDEPECLVKPPVKENTKPVDLVLHSDVRAVDRAEFDQVVQQKLSLMEQYKLEKERLQKLEEEEELRRLRKELVPKAQPMPYFDRPFIPRRSEKQPTIPKEPKFHNHPVHKKIKCCSSMSSWSDNMYAQSE